MDKSGKKAEIRKVEGLTWPEYVDATKKTDRAIIPVGALEAHGRCNTH